MKVIIIIEVEKCHDCLYVSNSSQAHNRSFTSAPHIKWFCNHPDRKKNPEYRFIFDHMVIDKYCPCISKEKIEEKIRRDIYLNSFPVRD